MKKYRILKTRRGAESIVEGTIEELIKYFSYTLECGRSYQHERGNKKIDLNPKTIKSLIKNLNNAASNSHSHYNDTFYELI